MKDFCGLQIENCYGCMRVRNVNDTICINLAIK